MKKILIGLVAATAILGTGVFQARSFEQPKNIPVVSESDFAAARSMGVLCGKLFMVKKSIDQNVFWNLFFLSDNMARPLFLVYHDRSGFYFWADNDRDGHFDEEFASEKALLERYPDPCSAVKK